MPELVRPGVSCVCCARPGERRCTGCHSVAYCGVTCQKRDWARHRRLCVPVMVQRTEDKGNGLVASKHFGMGDLILREKACLSRSKENGPDIFSQLNKMTADERNDFYNLTRNVLILQTRQENPFSDSLNSTLKLAEQELILLLMPKANKQYLKTVKIFYR